MSCPACKVPTDISYYYCPNCGRQLRDDAPLSTSFGKQLKLYLLCFFLPPFGLWPAFTYLNQPSLGAKSVGGIATVITIGVIVLVTYEILLFADIFKAFAPMVTSLLQMLGY